jgi:hypothetical protein
MAFDLKQLLGVPGYWYLASPYSKYPYGREAAFVDVCLVAAKLMDRHVRLFCPIAHTHPIARYTEHPDTQAFWLAHDLPLLHAATGLLVVAMPGWRESSGVAWEIEYAEGAGKPIHHLPWPLDLRAS